MANILKTLMDAEALTSIGLLGFSLTQQTFLPALASAVSGFEPIAVGLIAVGAGMSVFNRFRN